MDSCTNHCGSVCLPNKNQVPLNSLAQFKVKAVCDVKSLSISVGCDSSENNYCKTLSQPHLCQQPVFLRTFFYFMEVKKGKNTMGSSFTTLSAPQHNPSNPNVHNQALNSFNSKPTEFIKKAAFCKIKLFMIMDLSFPRH